MWFCPRFVPTFHKVYPYLLRRLKINRVNHIWCTDITYIRMRKGWVYLVAIMDWYSRYVLSWNISTTMEADFCVNALEESLMINKPEIFNSDQASQFTSNIFTNIFLKEGIKISMDGRGRRKKSRFSDELLRAHSRTRIFFCSNEVELKNIVFGDYFKSMLCSSFLIRRYPFSEKLCNNFITY